MAQRNNIYADGRVVVETTPSPFIFGAAASEEELQRNKDLDAVYDFIYGTTLSLRLDGILSC